MEEIQKEIRVVIDTNKIIASLLKHGKVRRLILYPRVKLYTVKDSYNEINKHKSYLLRKIDEKSFNTILNSIKSRINEVDVEDKYLLIAHKISKKFDEDDTPFIALALKLNIPIWTNDKEMIKFGLKTEKYYVLDTEALEDLIKGKNLEEIKEYLKKKYF